MKSYREISKILKHALKKHVHRNHTLRVEPCGDGSSDLQMYCVYCGYPVLAAPPSFVNDLAQVLIDRGITIVKQNPSWYSVRLH